MQQASLILASFLCLLLVLIRAFRNFDRLVQIQYDRYRQAWIADGEPSGFFWKPPEARHTGSNLAMQRLSLAWIFQAPDWMQNDSEARYFLKKLRFLFVAWNLGIVVWFLTMVTPRSG